MLSLVKGPDGAKLAEMMKYSRKILMTKPGFEPQTPYNILRHFLYKN
jgi:hypothetical protein